MSLLDQTNPLATPETVCRHAAFGAIIGATAGGLVGIFSHELRPVWWFISPLGAMLGAGTGALMNWQSLDMLDVGDVVEAIQSEFEIEIPESDWQKFETMGDVYRSVLAQLAAKESDSQGDVPKNWPELWGRFRRQLSRRIGIDEDEILEHTRLCEDVGIVTYSKAMELQEKV